MGFQRETARAAIIFLLTCAAILIAADIVGAT
jgi:hypothetical protein